MTMPDARLRPEAAVIVRVHLPTDDVFRRASLVSGSIEDPTAPRFVRHAATMLRDGETKFIVGDYGPKRVWIETANGKKLLYRDFNVTSESTVIDLAPMPIDVYGKVTQKSEPRPGTRITLADPADAGVILAQAHADDNGD